MHAVAARTVADRLRLAVNAHDLEALVDCFTESYRNETPVHPSRGFEGSAQVRSNWERIFAGVPDIQAEVLRTCADGDELWSEWEMHGTRLDGGAHVMRGVVIFGVVEDQASWARFYLEPLDAADDTADAAVDRIVAGRTSDTE